MTDVGTLDGSFQKRQGAIYRDELKTPESYLLGAHFGHRTCQTSWGLRPFKMVLLVILALVSDPLHTLSIRVIIA